MTSNSVYSCFLFCNDFDQKINPRVRGGQTLRYQIRTDRIPGRSTEMEVWPLIVIRANTGHSKKEVLTSSSNDDIWDKTNVLSKMADKPGIVFVHCTDRGVHEKIYHSGVVKLGGHKKTETRNIVIVSIPGSFFYLHSRSELHKKKKQRKLNKLKLMIETFKELMSGSPFGIPWTLYPHVIRTIFVVFSFLLLFFLLLFL